MAAHFWGMKPWELDTETPEHRAKLLAVYYVNREIENYYSREPMRKRNKEPGMPG